MHLLPGYFHFIGQHNYVLILIRFQSIEWNRTKQSGLSQEQEFKQMFGLITEMKSFVNKMSPGNFQL